MAELLLCCLSCYSVLSSAFQLSHSHSHHVFCSFFFFFLLCAAYSFVLLIHQSITRPESQSVITKCLGHGHCFPSRVALGSRRYLDSRRFATPPQSELVAP
ncbi:uncharacterized protein BO66DRAFT_77338 [Aspergillus aculeatinus CBS 121060]|uniref:Uncharacterized protein n=1 Tax=Aspergillus aculeatinus CBS 121060 TaxID=1448322 RepID=A0ACD1HA53_9EURO|nr:hypothetical protein BO66DRAFT_77338 [Aspergillus aculeatinus CBS 121060]RAH70640.1 hypothetical protein BO66DRAFT_77338 [Aspergillus aculeatinus CBS 121060]